MASAHHYVDTAGGVSVKLHVAWSNETTGGTINSIKQDFIFLKTNTYRVPLTVSL